MNRLPKQVILWGGTGQAKVVRPILEHYGSRVVAVFDDTPALTPPFHDIPLYRGWEGFKAWQSHHLLTEFPIGFCIAIGNPHGKARLRLHAALEAEGLVPATFHHPSAIIEPSAQIGPGTQIMAGAYVGVQAYLGKQCIVNTHASVDHEDILEDGVEVAPGATLCGLVHMKTNSWACAGSIILPRLTIGEDALVGAGAVVTRDVPDKGKVVGVPAYPIMEKGLK